MYETVEGKDVLIGKQTVVKNTVQPELIQVSAVRKDTNSATFKGTRFGESDIKTVYYCAVPYGDKGTLSWNSEDKEFKLVGSSDSFTPTTKKINMTGKDSFEETVTGLEPLTAYKIYYVLENSYGSQNPDLSGSVQQVGLSKATELQKEKQVNSETIKFTKADKKFKWNDPNTSGSKYIVTLYKDGKLLKEDTNVTSPEYDLTNDAKEAGTYYIEVVTKGTIEGKDSDKLNSDATRSTTVTVKAIANVSGIKLGVNNTEKGYPELSWTENDENCGAYDVKLYEQDIHTGVIDTTAAKIEYTTKNNAPKKSIYFTTEVTDGDPSWTLSTGSRIVRNMGYKVEIIAKPKADLGSDDDNTIYINSQAVEYFMYVPYRDATIESATDNSIKLKLGTTTAWPLNQQQCGYNLTEDNYTYAVRVFEGADKKDMGYKDVTVSYDYDPANSTKITATYFTVDGLKANTNYTFKLISKCDGFEGWSKDIENAHTMPRIENLTCASSSDAHIAGSTNFHVKNAASGSEEVEIGGVIYNVTTDYTDANIKTEFQALVKFLNTLQIGDNVTIKGDNVDLVLNKEENEKAIDLSSTYLTDKVVNLTGSGYERKVVGNVVSELHLKAGQFDISEVNLSVTSSRKEAGTIILENGVIAKVPETKTDLTVKPGTVQINNVKMTTQVETVIRAEQTNTSKPNDTQVLVVVANGENTNNLTFESVYDNANQVDNKNATIKFVSANNANSVQQGTITIKGEGGIVKVAQENVTVGSNITVTVEKGEVDVSESTLTGSKTVTLTGGEEKSITALAANTAPAVLKGQTVEIKHYENVEALKAALKDNVSAGYSITDTVVSEVNTWLATFGISGKEAEVTVDSTSDKVTIKYSGSETLTVQGLK